jgi:hypothetical protein
MGEKKHAIAKCDEQFVCLWWEQCSVDRRNLRTASLRNQEENFSRRSHPVYLASLSDRFYAASRLVEMYCIVPENDLYRLYQKENNNPQCLGAEAVTE